MADYTNYQFMLSGEGTLYKTDLASGKAWVMANWVWYEIKDKENSEK